MATVTGTLVSEGGPRPSIAFVHDDPTLCSAAEWWSGLARSAAALVVAFALAGAAASLAAGVPRRESRAVGARGRRRRRVCAPRRGRSPRTPDRRLGDRARAHRAGTAANASPSRRSAARTGLGRVAGDRDRRRRAHAGARARRRGVGAGGDRGVDGVRGGGGRLADPAAGAPPRGRGAVRGGHAATRARSAGDPHGAEMTVRRHDGRPRGPLAARASSGRRRPRPERREPAPVALPGRASRVRPLGRVRRRAAPGAHVAAHDRRRPPSFGGRGRDGAGTKAFPRFSLVTSAVLVGLAATGRAAARRSPSGDRASPRSADGRSAAAPAWRRSRAPVAGACTGRRDRVIGPASRASWPCRRRRRGPRRRRFRWALVLAGAPLCGRRRARDRDARRCPRLRHPAASGDRRSLGPEPDRADARTRCVGARRPDRSRCGAGPRPTGPR